MYFCFVYCVPIITTAKEDCNRRCFSVGPITNLKGHYFQPSESVCVFVCVSLTGTSTLQRGPILIKLGHKDPALAATLMVRIGRRGTARRFF